MTEVLDSATGQIVDHPDDQIAADWNAGKVQPLAGRAYTFRYQNGSYGTASTPQELATAVQQGGQFVPHAQAQAAVDAQKYEGETGGALGAGAAGALSQATLGLSDLAGHAILGDSFSKARRYQESAHPYASMLGEGVGAAGLAALTGGGSLAEQGAAAGLEGLGEAGLSGIARRAMAKGAAAAVEGAQFGVSQSVSQAAIENPQLAGEQFVANVGANALWGGLLGTALGAGGELLGHAVDRRFTRAADALEAEPSADALATVGGKALGVEPAEGLGDKIAGGYAKLAGAASGHDPEAILDLWRNRADIEGAEEARNAASRAIRDQVDTVLKASRDIQEEGQRSLKRGYIRASIEGVHPEEAYRASRDAVDTTIGTLQEMLASPDDFGGAAPLQHAMKLAQRASKALDEAAGTETSVERRAVPLADIEEKPTWSAEKAAKARAAVESGDAEPVDLTDAGGGKLRISDGIHRVAAARELGMTELPANVSRSSGDVAEMFGIVDDLKKAIGKYTKGASKLSPGAATDELIALQNRARAGKLQDLDERLRTGLEDESVWKRAAVDQKAINAAWTTQIDASNRFHSALTTEIGRDPSNPWVQARGVDPAKSDAYVRGLLDPSKDLTHKAVTDYIASTRKLADTMSEAYELPAGKLAKVAELRRAADAFGQTIDDTSKRLATVNQYEALKAQTGGHAAGLASIVGHMVGGLPGGAAGLALGKGWDALMHPAELIRKVAVLEQMASKSDNRIVRTLRAFGRGGARATSTPMLDAFPRRAAQVERLAADPAAMTARVQGSTLSLAPHAPQVQHAIVGTVLAGVQFLASKLPPSPAVDPLNPKAKRPLPSPAVRESFLRYQRAVDDPHTVLEDLRDGRLAPEGVEALRTVYPQLYGRVQQKTLAELTEGRLTDLTASQRYGLATLLDLPVPELAPQYLAARQQAIAQPLGAFDPQPPAPSGGQQKPSKRSKALPEPKQGLTAERLATSQ